MFKIPHLNINKAQYTSFTTYFNIIPTNCKPKQQTDSVNVQLLQNFNTLAKQVSFLSKRNVIGVRLKLSVSTKKKKNHEIDKREYGYINSTITRFKKKHIAPKSMEKV